MDKDLAFKINNCAYAQMYGFEDDEDADPYIILLSEVEDDCNK